MSLHTTMEGSTKATVRFGGAQEDWDEWEYYFTATASAHKSLVDIPDMLSFDLTEAAEAALLAAQGYTKANTILFGLLVASVDISASTAHLLLRQHSATRDGRAALLALRERYAPTTEARKLALRRQLTSATMLM